MRKPTDHRPGMPDKSLAAYPMPNRPFRFAMREQPWPFIVLLSGFLIVLLASSSFSFASPSDTAPKTDVNLSVVDEENRPVANATVELRLTGKVVATASTDAKGKASVALKSGKYMLTVAKDGFFKSESALETTANAAGPQELEVVLSAAVVNQEKVTVNGTASNPVTETTSASATSIAPAQAKQVPSRPATVADVLPLIPGIVRANDGSVRIAGYGENHSALLINSVDVTDPATGEFGLTVPIDSVDTVSVSEMPYLAQYGRFTAGVVTADTKRGGDKWEYSLNDPLPEFRIRSGHVEGLKDATPRFNVSGPILANRLYILEGAEYLINKQEVFTLPFPANQTTSRAINSFTQADAILSPNQTLTASFHYAPHSVQYSGLDFFNPQPVTPDANLHESTATILDRLAVGGGLLQSTFATTRVNSAITPQGTADMILTPVGNQGNYFSQQSRLSTRFEWIENWAPRTLHFAGDHFLQVGSVLAHSENDGQFNAKPVLIQDATGHPIQRIDFTGGSSFGVSDLEPAVYLQDHWIMNPHFAVDTGVRFEAQTITATTRSAPRTGFVWSPGEDGKTVVRGGVGVFYDYVPLDLYAFNKYPAQTITSYNSSGAVIGAPIQFMNLTQAAAQAGFPLIDRGASNGNFAPYSVAWNVELERSINPFLTLRFKYLQSQAEDQITIQPEIIQNQNAFVLGSSGSARTRQFEFTARIGSGSRRQFFFSYVRQHARGDVNEAAGYLGNFPFPVLSQNLIASLPSEIPNRFLLWGTYALPRKMQVIPHVEYRNGFPYQSTNVLQQYLPVTAGPQSRFPRYLSLDVRVSKDFQISPKHAIRLSATILNLTNHFNPLEVHSNVADPLYGTFFGNHNRHAVLDFDFLF